MGRGRDGGLPGKCLSGEWKITGKGVGQCDKATWVCSPMLIEIRLLASHRDWEIGVLSLRVAWKKTVNSFGSLEFSQACT